jgi:hypothetical protein
MYFDSDTVAYMGYQRLWQRLPGSTTWTGALTPDPKLGGKLCDIVMSEPQHDTMYLAYRDESGHFSDPANDVGAGRLFRSFEAMDNPAPWTNITPGVVRWMRINDIETDDLDMKRLWVAFGNIPFWRANTPPDSMTSRIFYSGNFGINYVDVSRGLPCSPVNKLLYQQGTNRLYAATDVGVFTCDFSTFNPSATQVVNGDTVNWSVQWTCFNNGLPPVVANDMEFNHCAGKLRLATFGRGMWETPLYPSAWTIPPGNSEVIRTNTTWDGTRYITGNVIIDSGATLTITDPGTVIHMPRNSHITVKPGAKIIVQDSARLTNSCEDCFWWGIVAQGTKNLPQQPFTNPDHAMVIVKNGSIIEHARHAVTLWDIHGDANKTGAIIHASNSSFLNNKNSISFVDFPYENKSAIINCTFEVNDDYKGHNIDYPFGAHITMWAVHGVDIIGCRFYNNDTHPQNEGRHSGIITGESGFTIRPRCTNMSFPCNSWQRSEFAGFRNGINMGAGLSFAHPVIVDRADFDRNTVGIRNISQNTLTVTRSEFNMGHGLPTNLNDDDIHYMPSCPWNIGIYTNLATSFMIEENTFNGHATPGIGNIGTLTVSSGNNNNTIYKCAFNDLTHAAVASRVNGYPSVYNLELMKGLRYQCNSFDDNVEDVHVAAYPNCVLGNQLTYDEGIACFQGYWDNSGMYSPGNTFSNSNLNLINEGYPFDYHYNGGIPAEEPPTNLGLIEVSGWASAKSCPSHFTDDFDISVNNNVTRSDLFTVSVSQLRTSWDSLDQVKSTALSNYAAEIDGGSTPALLSYIGGLTPDSSLALRNRLNSYSPYLSKQSIAASLTILSRPHLEQVLLNNPDLLRRADYQQFLSTEITPPLSGFFLATLNAMTDSFTKRGKDEARIVSIRAEMDELAKRILLCYKLDTLDANTDSMPIWYRKIASLDAEYNLAGHYFSLGDTTKASQVIDSIPVRFALTDSQDVFYQAYADLYDIAKGILADGRRLNSPDSVEITAVNALINSGPHEFGVFAAKAFGNDATLDPPGPSVGFPNCLEDAWVEARKSNPNQPLPGLPGLNLEADAQLLVSPNPAKDIVYFKYDVPDGEKLSISVLNPLGQTSARFILNGSKGAISWDTKAVPAGTYIYQLTGSKGQIKTGKLVIVK